MIVASCGHEVDDQNIGHVWKGLTRDCKPCLNYGQLCTKCADDYRRLGALVKIIVNGKTVWSNCSTCDGRGIVKCWNCNGVGCALCSYNPNGIKCKDCNEF